jgi:dTDP-glucose pyrophosphorylase
MSRTVVITMAGRGSRFKRAGIETPKYVIEIDGRTMFEYALGSLADLVDDRFVFVTRADHGVDDVVAEHCERAGIDDHATVSVQSVTDGQASTALVADDLVPDDDTVAIYNIDTYVEADQLQREGLGTGHCIPVFRPSGDRWSFVERDADGAVRRVTEKERVSELATVGFYQFRSWRRFRSAYHEDAKAVKAEYGETYIAPLYNQLLDAGEHIDILELDTDTVHVLGTPEDLTNFYPAFPQEHGIEL